ncbi:signal recognition particle-docking protein FtsY [Holzapfeliella floricola]|uniref:Signal recognition particle receptor FtsY n=1 Tax=Holzapfeliella floricola DSM 23037 = JCM 16512 TaxID=1423744 RepID=A0A0R2DIB1_9LACO|nr:signal recognition particle-docking protein FtsY [Holzapfeliella floricola]KRN03823.1 signal recognition particle receptor FtsY [Holzapfeliella floricola DSM 23037 = JCM 16512]
MGLFDRIKKSIFGDKKEQEDKKESAELEEAQEQPSDEEPKEADSAQNPVDAEETNQDSEATDEPEMEPTKEVDKEESVVKETKENADSKEESSEQEPADEDNQEQSSSDEVSTQTVDEVEEETDTEIEQPTSEEVQAEEESEDDEEEKTEHLYEKGLEKTNRSFGDKLNAFFANFRRIDEDFFDDLEDLLIESDVGYETSMNLVEALRDEAKLKNAKSKQALKEVIVEKLVGLYENPGEEDEGLTYNEANKPNIYLFVGVNGSGKTTTVGKLAAQLRSQGKSVMLVAADTFRAGAVQQLVQWGERVGVNVVTGPEKADPASVVFEGVKRAYDQEVDYLLIDTAGRLQNKVNLMNELDKIKRTIQKTFKDQPEETLLVLDGSTGQNAMSQAKEFNQVTQISGIVLTKLDGSSRGGIVIAIRNEMNIPVKLVGLGEQVGDLAPFDTEKFALGLFKGLI